MVNAETGHTSKSSLTAVLHRSELPSGQVLMNDPGPSRRPLEMGFAHKRGQMTLQWVQSTPSPSRDGQRGYLLVGLPWASPRPAPRGAALPSGRPCSPTEQVRLTLTGGSKSELRLSLLGMLLSVHRGLG